MFLLPLSLWAHSEITLPPTHGHHHGHDGPQGSRHKSTPCTLEWWSASDSQVLGSPCRSEVDFEQITQKLKKLSLKNLGAQSFVRGASFSYGSKEILNSFKDLVTRYDFSGSALEEGEQIDIQKDFQVNPQCHDVLCAVKEIFGKRVGPKILYLKHFYGLNSSHLVYSNAAPINLEEVRSFIRSVRDFPEHLFPLENNRKMVRFKRGMTLAIYGSGNRTLANATMAFFDGWEDLGLNGQLGRKDYVCTHEIGHVLGRALNDIHDSKEWLEISGWEETEDGWIARYDHRFSSCYAQTNPREDFAETVSAYRYNPSLLKNVAPRKYQFMKEYVFGGVEYLDQKQCNGEKKSLVLRKIEKAQEQAEFLNNQDIKELFESTASTLSEAVGLFMIDKIVEAQMDRQIQASVAQHLVVENEKDFIKDEISKNMLASQVMLMMRNTSIDFLSRDQVDDYRNILLKTLRDHFAENMLSLSYYFRIRNASSREEVKKSCRDYAKNYISDSELRELFDGSRMLYQIREKTKELKLDFCLETTLRIGASSRPRRVDAYYHANKLFVDKLDLEGVQIEVSSLFEEIKEVKEKRSNTRNPIKKLRLSREISALISSIEKILGLEV